MSKKNLWVTLALVAAIVAIFVVSFALAPKASEDESFAGTDSVVTSVLEEEGAEPWFEPIFTPGSGEIESGLFALQAALGAGVVGFALGNLRGRVKTKEELAATASGSGSSPTAVNQPAATAVE